MTAALALVAVLLTASPAEAAGGQLDASVGEGAAGGGFAVARFRRDGSLDPGFAGNGKTVTRFRGGGGARAVALQPDGRIVVAGTAGDVFGPFGVVRYRRDGRLDASFGRGGRVAVSLGRGEQEARADRRRRLQRRPPRGWRPVVAGCVRPRPSPAERQPGPVLRR